MLVIGRGIGGEYQARRIADPVNSVEPVLA